MDDLIQQIKNTPNTVEFDQVMAVIDANYDYSESAFSNGLGDDRVENPAGENAGSCRIFAFAKINGLNASQTLVCFGKYFREDVIAHPEGTDHANIRTFMRHGWQGIRFDQLPLLAK
ncbi:MAG: HopJ type III effector protein [Gammaproteobacteria bacterium]|nr:HopJ type III effector protein [Gammaproteobacteria bacterium]MBQ0840559.1 HopJ type III effector protein [Gammaproteobacteria bacterium]